MNRLMLVMVMMTRRTRRTSKRKSRKIRMNSRGQLRSAVGINTLDTSCMTVGAWLLSVTFELLRAASLT